MTKSTITRERLEKIKSWRETYGAGSNVMLPAEEAEELARMALAAMDSEHVRREHAAWSQATFSNVGPVGPLKHLAKEAIEAAAEPDDLSEWADMQFLMWDAQRRAGITDEQITLAMVEKLAVNKQREWPEPKDGEPRMHIKEQPALVIPDEISLEKVAEMTAARGAEYSIRDGIIAAKWWNACRAAMLQAGNPPVIPEGYVMVPMRLTAENGAKGALSGEFSETKFVNCPECFGDDECETCDGSGRIEITVPVTWTTIKEIWAKGVEHFAAAPQEVPDGK
ncbi:dATP/dGTP pyrophosphohydrolase domain-containing protein [Klebsiella michiganensis]|uniref:dATP/dGTP pyrophosphohydrolase domain-containing protein n=1 Tax=Klebsiella michiganensis TaxID=1134687 RepID=UPI0034A0C6F4